MGGMPADIVAHMMKDPGGPASAAIPIGLSGRSMLDAQKFRLNWYELSPSKLVAISRVVAERNWFARTVLKLRRATAGFGFHFRDEAARVWVESGTYDFGEVHRNVLHEWSVSTDVAAIWRRDPPPGELPWVIIPNREDVQYQVVHGQPVLKVTLQKDSKLPESRKGELGEAYWNAVRNGKPLEIRKGDPASGWDFEVMLDGKSTAPFGVPEMTSILDDLDFVEAVRVGNWNGAYARRELIRHTTKGYGVSSGPNAGTARNNAKNAELRAIVDQMKKIAGKQDIATNFDQEIKWLLFPKEFFSADILEDSLRRLIHWSGIFGILCLKMDSQAAGLAPVLMDRLRTEIEAFREDQLGSFLSRIFNAASFRGEFADAPRLVPAWSVKPLYSAQAFNQLITLVSTYGIRAPQSIRGMMGVDDLTESTLLREAHARREDFTPPFEPRQGLIQAMFPDELGDGGTQGDSQIPGQPGRPSNA